MHAYQTLDRMLRTGLGGDAYWGLASQSIAPPHGLAAVRAMTLAQVELMTLATRRAQAYLEVPKTLGRCRSGQDLLEEQMRFWQVAGEQYQGAGLRIANAWMQAFMPFSAHVETTKANGSRHDDLIELPPFEGGQRETRHAPFAPQRSGLSRA